MSLSYSSDLHVLGAQSLSPGPAIGNRLTNFSTALILKRLSDGTELNLVQLKYWLLSKGETEQKYIWMSKNEPETELFGINDCVAFALKGKGKANKIL